MKNIKILLALACILVVWTCSEDDNWNTDNPPVEQEQPNNFSDNFGSPMNARFIGKVINEENNPVSGVLISIGSSITTTDSNGIFSIENASVFEKFAYIKATKDGFINGSRALVPSDGINQVTIMLLSADPIATVNSGEASIVDLPNGTQVSFDGGFVTDQGVNYAGQVKVVLKHLNPDNSNMELQMPGMLFAENANGSPRVLETYGMIAVELLTPSDEKLQLAPGSTSEITIPVPQNVTSAPATIPLWSFDEENGYWKEEGQATLQGNTYVGTVSHFSFWNWDYQYPAVTLCITLIDDSSGNLLPYTALDLYSPALASTGTYGYTNADGVECGLVPADDELTLVVPDFGCDVGGFTTTIGPFSTDQNITIIVSDSEALITNFIGTFNNCDGNPITNGYMQLIYNDSTHTIPIDNGMLDLAIDYCSDNSAYSALVVDLLGNQTTDVTNGNFTQPTTDVGSQMSCVDLVDSDNDGVFDIDEDINNDSFLDNDDTDADGIPNYLDEDDDGDGVNTIDEDRDNDGDPTNDDSDGDGIPDYLDEMDVLIYNQNAVFGSGCIPNLVFDFNDVIAQAFSDIENNTYVFYLTLADAQAETNPLSNSFTSDGSINSIHVTATNILSNQSATVQVFLLQDNTDSDDDGLTDCEELTGIDANAEIWPFCNPNGNITDPNNSDTDDDGYNDCAESQAGTDPNDPDSFPNVLVFNCCNNDSLSDLDVNTITDPNAELSFVEVFTPNSDGINDSFVIDNIELYPNNELLIFDGQNNLVFETISYTNNGNFFQGISTVTEEDLSDGTYRYELTFSDTTGETNIRNGFVCLVTGAYPNIDFTSECDFGDTDPLLN